MSDIMGHILTTETNPHEDSVCRWRKPTEVMVAGRYVLSKGDKLLWVNEYEGQLVDDCGFDVSSYGVDFFGPIPER